MRLHDVEAKRAVTEKVSGTLKLKRNLDGKRGNLELHECTEDVVGCIDAGGSSK